MKPFARIFFLACSLAFLSTLAFGAAEFTSMQQAAQGESLTGANLLNDSLYSNPAGSSFVNVYSVDGTFEFPKTFEASILDTKTTGMGGAFGYFREAIDGSSEALQGLKGALSGRVSDQIGLGLALKSLWGPAENPNGTFYHDKLTDLDAGILVNLGTVQLGGTLRNLMGGNARLDDQDREFSIGGRINYQQILFFSAAIDSRIAYPKPYQYGLGVEYDSPYFLSASAGYRVQPDYHLSYWSAGMGFVSPKLSIHYAVEFPSSVLESTTHFVGVTMLF